LVTIFRERAVCSLFASHRLRAADSTRWKGLQLPDHAGLLLLAALGGLSRAAVREENVDFSLR